MRIETYSARSRKALRDIEFRIEIAAEADQHLFESVLPVPFNFNSNRGCKTNGSGFFYAHNNFLDAICFETKIRDIISKRFHGLALAVLGKRLSAFCNGLVIDAVIDIVR